MSKALFFMGALLCCAAHVHTAEEWFAPAARVADYKPKGPTHCFRQFNIDWSWIARDPQQIPEFLSQADPAAIAEFCARMNIDGTVVMAVPHHGYCTHETRVGQKFPGMKGDWFGRTIEELHKRKIAAFGYVTLNWNWKYIREHEGEPFIHVIPSTDGFRGEICLNAPGYLKLVESYTREVLENYPVDGMRWDILTTYRGCTCQGCKMWFLEFYGEDLRDWADFPPERQMDFYLRTTTRAVMELRGLCKSIKPSVEIWQNSIQSYTPNDLTLGRIMDIAYNEYGDPFRLLFLKGVMNKPAAINGLMNRTPPIVPLEREAFRWCLTLGGRCYSYFGHKLTDHRTLLPGPEMIKWHETELAPFYRMVSEIEPWLTGARPVANIGMIYKENTRYRYPEYKRDAYVDPMQKITEGFLRRSIPLEFINALDLPERAKSLDQFTLLVVPQTSGLDGRELQELCAYAERGGTLLIAGDALRHDARGKEQKDFALAEAMGVSFSSLQQAPKPATIAPTPSWSFGPVRPLGPLGPFVSVKSQKGETLLHLKSGEQSWPLLHLNKLGAGRIAYLATMASTDLTTTVMASLAGPPPVTVSDGSRQVVLTHQVEKKQWMLHLIGEGDYSIQLNRRLVPASRIVSQYPASGWQCAAEKNENTLQLQIQGNARDRLVVLQ